MTTIKSIAESAAAISDCVHNGKAKYRKFYERVTPQTNGFTGIWSFIADVAIELERQHPQEWDGEWIDVCFTIGNLILEADALTDETARSIVTKALIEDGVETGEAELMSALKLAVRALNQVPRHPVDDTDSYNIVAACEKTLRKFTS